MDVSPSGLFFAKTPEAEMRLTVERPAAAGHTNRQITGIYTRITQKPSKACLMPAKTGDFCLCARQIQKNHHLLAQIQKTAHIAFIIPASVCVYMFYHRTRLVLRRFLRTTLYLLTFAIANSRLLSPILKRQRMRTFIIVLTLSLLTFSCSNTDDSKGSINDSLQTSYTDTIHTNNNVLNENIQYIGFIEKFYFSNNNEAYIELYFIKDKISADEYEKNSKNC
jgi:hypothetical protein